MNIDNNTFFNLLERLKVNSDSNFEIVVVNAKLDCYSLEVYKDIVNNEFYYDTDNLNVEYFTSMIFGSEDNVTLTDYQFSLLNTQVNSIIENHLKECENALKDDGYDDREHGIYHFGY